MKYLVALALAGLLIAGLSIHMQQRALSLQQRIKQRLVKARQAGDLPADFDVDRPDLTDIGMEVTAGEMQEINVIDLWMNFRVYVCSALLAASLVTAALIGNWPRKGKVSQPPGKIEQP